MAFELRTAAFDDGGMIPEGFTCDGADSAPPLDWTGAPEATQAFALILDDPDAPRGTFTHWLLYDIPANVTSLAGQRVGKALMNDFGRDGYGGPCPPPGHGVHRYVFTLHAVDVPHLAPTSRTRSSLEHALRGHVLATARLVGRYGRK